MVRSLLMSIRNEQHQSSVFPPCQRPGGFACRNSDAPRMFVQEWQMQNSEESTILHNTSPDSTVSATELQQMLSVGTDAAKLGGRVLQEWVGRFTVREKSRANLVTEADEASQRAIREHLQRHYPDHGFLGEENVDDRERNGDAFWIVDPLDGTTNYVHGFPYYCVSVGLMLGGNLVVGIIHDPSRDETFTAAIGQGAYLNGLPVRTSAETSLELAMGMASLPIAADPENPAVARFFRALVRMQTVQRTGSAALNLAYVACGRIDAFWSSSLFPWDVAAGALLVTEAGGTLTSLTGDKFDLFVPSLLAASTPTLGKELITAFR